MNARGDDAGTVRLDGLRLVALGRIPQCRGCPRFGALVRRHQAGGAVTVALPAVPEFCTHQYCSPLVARPAPGESPQRELGRRQSATGR